MLCLRSKSAFPFASASVLFSVRLASQWSRFAPRAPLSLAVFDRCKSQRRLPVSASTAPQNFLIAAWQTIKDRCLSHLRIRDLFLSPFSKSGLARLSLRDAACMACSRGCVSWNSPVLLKRSAAYGFALTKFIAQADHRQLHCRRSEL